MKESKYNFFFRHTGEKALGFNTYSNTAIVISKQLYGFYKINRAYPEKIKNIYPYFYGALVENGFITEIDEQKEILSVFKKEVESKERLGIVVNPTLDCNLKCWYCYETHVEDSILSLKNQNNILDIIKKKAVDETKVIDLKWFGGEPLIALDNVVYPLSTSIYKLCQQRGLKFLNHITTNGTLINENSIKVLKDCHVGRFQITVDGTKETHGRVKKYKKSAKNPFDDVIKGINLITDYLPHSGITLRINYTEEVLDEFQCLIDLLSQIIAKKDNIRIDLQKVWQINDKKITPSKLIDAKRMVKNSEFKLIDECGFIFGRNYLCYADIKNSFLCNYNGDIFKCTAKDFPTEKKDGFINQDGEIVYFNENYSKRYDRLPIEKMGLCLKCKLLPICKGPCSQATLEGAGKQNCRFYNAHLNLKQYLLDNYL